MRLGRSRILLFAVLLIPLLCRCADQPRDLAYKYSVVQLREDFSHLRESIERHHPMYFTDRNELIESFDTQFALLEDSLTILDFYRIISPAIANVRCGHTRLSLPESIDDQLFDNGNYLPFDIQVVNDSLVVLENLSEDSTIGAGCLILSINGRPAQEIIDRIKSSLWTDGENETYKYYQMNQSFKQHYLNLVENPTQFEITYTASESLNPKQAVVRAKSLREIREFKKARGISPQQEKLIETSLADGNRYAILKISFFGFYDRLDEFAEQIDVFFRTLADRNIRSLILDLRGNDGGDPYSSAYLLGYLIGRPFRYFAARSTFLYQNLKEVQSIPDTPYSGEIYVLVDGGCYSTTGHFCSLLRYHGIGTFIGEETGGSYACNGGYKEHSLKHTGIILLLPHTTFITDVDGLERGHGIIPDLIIQPTTADIISGNDPVLDTAISLISNPN